MPPWRTIGPAVEYLGKCYTTETCSFLFCFQNTRRASPYHGKVDYTRTGMADELKEWIRTGQRRCWSFHFCAQASSLDCRGQELIKSLCEPEERSDGKICLLCCGSAHNQVTDVHAYPQVPLRLRGELVVAHVYKVPAYINLSGQMDCWDFKSESSDFGNTPSDVSGYGYTTLCTPLSHPCTLTNISIGSRPHMESTV